MSLCKDAYPEVVREERPSEFSIDAVSDGPRQHGTHTAAGTTQRHRQLFGCERRGALRQKLHCDTHNLLI